MQRLVINGFDSESNLKIKIDYIEAEKVTTSKTRRNTKLKEKFKKKQNDI